MPKLTFEELQNFLALAESKLDINSIPVFVESGTYLGETTETAAKIFRECHTVELEPGHYNRALQKFRNNSSVFVHQGQSNQVFRKILPDITDPVFFWLDGHWSGGNTARGPTDVPLLEEIDVVLQTCNQHCVIVIDDVRLFGTKVNEDWSEVTQTAVLSKFMSANRLVDFDTIGDRMLLYVAKCSA
jgi:hypothetical protein